MSATTSLYKCHGLGNDFLVSLEPDSLPGGEALDEAFVRAVCHRRRGIGADGLVVARPSADPSAVARMELRNSDGSLAETSGNGLRCLALALVAARGGLGPVVVVETAVGLRRCALEGGMRRGRARVSTEMGTIAVGEEVDPAGAGAGQSSVARLLGSLLAEGCRAWPVDAGNPHLVVLAGGIDDVDVGVLGPKLEHAVAGGQNVEVAAMAADGALDLCVWERGAGLTEACGTGSCAAAAVARANGLAGDRVAVRNPGGALTVLLEGPVRTPAGVLVGPACLVGRVDLDLGALDALGALDVDLDLDAGIRSCGGAPET